MKIYISGRIKDNEHYVKQFAAAEARLKARDPLGTVVNPVTIAHVENATYADFMRADLAALLECDAIYMLNGWEWSVGARLEHHVAALCGIQIRYEDSEY